MMNSETTGVMTETPAEQVQEQVISPQLRKRNRIEAWLLLLPALLFQLAWGWYPMVMAILLGFTNGNVLRPLRYTGWDNYDRVLTDQVTIDALRVTIFYSAMSITLTFLIPIIVAVLIMEMPRKVTYAMMFLWFLPLSSITSLMLWRYFYDVTYGLFQFIISGIFHLPHQQFLNDPQLVLFWLIFPSIFFFGPGLIYMATLQSVPLSYYEAAEVEGTGFWRKLWTITFPRLRPIIWMMMLLALAGSLQPFDQMKILTNGGPGGASRTLMMVVYDQIGDLKYGDAAALSAVIFAITLVIVIAFRFLVKDDPDA